MRNVNAGILASTSNIEPYNIVSIEWLPGIRSFYSDRAVDDIPGNILELNDFSTQTRLDSSGSSAQVSLKLSDVNGSLKHIFNTVDMQRRPIIIYQAFYGIPSDERFIIFEGEIATPILWDEGERTVQISAITKLTDVEIGFAPESGQFPRVNEQLLGKPWPLVFGKPLFVACQNLQQVPVGTTTEPFGVPDPTLTGQGAAYIAYGDETYNTAIVYAFQAAVLKQNGDESGYDQLIALANQLFQQAAQANDVGNNLVGISLSQRQYLKDSIGLIGGEKFPQGKELLLKIGEGLFYGTVSTSRVNGKLRSRLTGMKAVYVGSTLHDDFQISSGNGFVPLRQQQNFTFYNAGSQVTIIGDYPTVWIANIIPSTKVKVYAYRSENGLRRIQRVPQRYYTVSTKVFGTLHTTAITLKRPLTSISYFDNERTQLTEDFLQNIGTIGGEVRGAHLVSSPVWEEQIYAVLESQIGPNPVDILIWLIQTYTDKQYNVAKFDACRTLLSNYPMNFVMSDRQNVFRVLADIAYQARCALWLTDGEFQIKYLPLEVDSVATITLDDIFQNSVQVSVSDTENLTTKYIATWKPDYLHDSPNVLTLRHNIKRYGIVESTHDFYALTDLEVVRKVATFWMVRDSNSWKKLSLSVPIKYLGLEVFDTVTLDFASRQDFVSDAPVKAIVESVSYDSGNNEVKLVCWIPILAGSMVPYPFAWPSDINENLYFPTYYEITGGGAGASQFVDGVTGSLPEYYSGSIDVSHHDNNFSWETDYVAEQAPGPSIEAGKTQRQTQGSISYSAPRLDSSFYQPSDYGTRKLSDIGDATPESKEPDDVEVEQITEPEFNYEYPTIQGYTVADQPATSAFPGQVVSGTGNTYTVEIWPKGKSEASQTVECEQLQIDSGEQIPPGTACLVALAGGTYYMQVPVWLPPATS